jgi:uncharacterized metal-binding protein YceD (DUF177 family)
MVTVAKVNEGGLVQKIAAKSEEMHGIAGYLDLVDVGTLSADITLTRWRSKGIRVKGKLKADVTQSCVVTLDPVPAHIEAEFERRFLPAEFDSANDEPREVFVDPEGEDPPEPLGREIDLGEILVEELALSLEPYPRKPGVAFEAQPEAAVADLKPNPFAALAKLKPKPDPKR